MKEIDQQHLSVFVNEVIEYLEPKQGDIFVDGTLGLGGHAKEILSKIGIEGKLIGIDRDQEALKIAQERLKEFSDCCYFVHDNFRNIDKILNELKIEEVNGVVLDLGISSLQIDHQQRGFSFRFDAPLDMRMNKEDEQSAFDIVNTYSETEISALLKDYGEERWHRRIAKAIVEQRDKNPIDSTVQLTEIILKAIPKKRTREKIHPATRTFQALRIEVNDELGSISEILDKYLSYLKVGGRIAVISFHSLEDRIVKHKFKAAAQEKKLKLIVKKPLRPTEEEIQYNPRARSARLRIAERL